MTARLALAAMVAALSASGCFRMINETRTQRIEVVSTPTGAWVHQSDLQGRRFVGRAPLTVERPYKVIKKRFRYWNWVWPVVFGGCVGGAGAAMDGPGPYIMGVCAPGLLVSLIVDIVGTARSGKVTPVSAEAIQLSAHLDNHSREERTLQVPGPERQVAFHLRPATASVPVATASPLGPPVPAAPPPARPPGRRGKRAIVAVFDVEDAAGRLTEKVLNQLTDFLAAKVAEEGGYRVVPRDQLRARLVEEKKQGYKKCYDESCQIDLGKAVSAQKSLATKLLRVGETCAISATLYDLRTETTEKATSIRTSCAESSLMEALESIARRLRP